VKIDDPDLCFACEGARKVLINMGPGRGVEWHTCKSCDGTGWKPNEKLSDCRPKSYEYN